MRYGQNSFIGSDHLHGATPSRKVSIERDFLWRHFLADPLQSFTGRRGVDGGLGARGWAGFRSEELLGRGAGGEWFRFLSALDGLRVVAERGRGLRTGWALKQPTYWWGD